ncbi:MAG: response regulator, partial [Chloroflexi bacterium]|nr:response regulator [Chloroflexota bacterium]
KILIVDDEPDARRFLSLILRINRYDPIEAPSGQAALVQAAAARPGLILLDVMMPRMDGYETCLRLKADPGTADVPVVMVSAKSQPSEIAAGLRAGADAYLLKPVDVDRLLELVGRLALGR